MGSYQSRAVHPHPSNVNHEDIDDAKQLQLTAGLRSFISYSNIFEVMLIFCIFFKQAVFFDDPTHKGDFGYGSGARSTSFC
jgi:hypothetical protein